MTQVTKERAGRNRTLFLTDEQEKEYLKRCLELSDVLNHKNIKNKTIHGDAFDILPHLLHESFDLIVADPPYNLTKEFASTKFNRKTDLEYIEYTRRWLQLIKPLLKSTGSIYVCCDWHSSLLIGPVLSEFFSLQNRITWQREKGRGAKTNWKNSMEDIWFATNSSCYTFNLEAVKIRKRVIAPYKVDGIPKDWNETKDGNYRDTCPSNFWDDITIPFWSMPENTDHPTQKSEKLLAKIILASSNPGDLVLDPFLGSGTTSVVAKKLGRCYVGIEQEQKYCALAEKRLELAELDNSIQGYTDGVFWERNTGNLQSQCPKSIQNKESNSKTQCDQYELF